MAKMLRLGARVSVSNIQVPVTSSVVSTIKTEELMNDHINSLCKNNLYREALEAFDSVQRNSSFKIRLRTYVSLICACSSSRSLAQGRKIHDHMLKSNCKYDTILNNHILSMYGKCGSLRDARDVFDFMPERNLVSYTSVITGYSQNGQGAEAIKLYLKMLQEDLVPDQFAFGSIIKACASTGDAGLGKQLHAQVIKLESSSHLIAQNALIAMYVRFNQISDASKVFYGIPMKDLISWSSIIAGFSQLGYEFEALSHLNEMLSFGVFHPNEYIFGSSLKACSSLLRPDYGSQIHGLCIKAELAGNAIVGCSLCDMYARCGFLNSARRVFNQIERPDTASWNVIIAGLANNGYANEAVSVFSQMRNSGFIPDAISLRSLLCAQTKPMALCQGMQIHSFIIKCGFLGDLSVCNSLLSMYTFCSDLYCCFNLFEDFRNNADSVTWNAILTACLQHEQPVGMLRLFKLMLVSECEPDYITMGSLLRGCVEISSLKLGSQVHCYSLKTGLVLEQFIKNGLIDMYAKCGSLGQARRIFDSMDNGDVVSWSTLLVGYAQSGFGEETLILFRDMKAAGIEPNHVTFVGVLSACSHVGLVEEGLKLYASMQTEHGISPTKEHCSCIIDLLARAGHLNEAEKFIDEMKLEPDVVVWKTLLSACKTQGNMDMAKKAAENILKIDPFNSTAHVMLCSMHASSGNWEDAALLRSSMKKQDVKKIPGQSWIEVKDKIHIFLAEDVHHPKRDDIYTVLHNVWLQVLDECDPQHKNRIQFIHETG
ncbi:PREDICTED: pentatricopeptide repeat-containing protein At3g53360, mitochondrial [Camelina sativa]|uniref:Pentatricopeptide repeat-containing protein At3g53360, mitochondrial n=1 Tax=Camelina sativa TaxID=90675 RepID=A0ABM0YPQ8_CAMSA|nr:PREDICTED: pentatricopeptide repeat-containing protein At3g53360, mitochondrial [Camelina sativa]XP_010504097.1 PREDICTED: pentatricopeptide repeat-containing protein At3g53360, mitochondrial [Camelina sativa]XP_010504098.1 PREDICTED: pentatricopeptide repeat-containing protein At3g53360, mitochondrial [Camelina sativa]